MKVSELKELLENEADENAEVVFWDFELSEQTPIQRAIITNNNVFLHAHED